MLFYFLLCKAKRVDSIADFYSICFHESTVTSNSMPKHMFGNSLPYPCATVALHLTALTYSFSIYF